MSARYQVVRLIRRGGMAEVFEGVLHGDDGFRRPVALKRLREEIESDPGSVDSFREEARILGQLAHRGVVSILDFARLEGRMHQILELIDGLDLEAALERLPGGVLSVPLAMAIGRELATALDYVHSATDPAGRALGIVHRDLKPSNVMLGRRGDVKLIDFGVAFARERDARTKVGLTKGTLQYMAPEQASGAPVDARTDVFGLACLLHRILTGTSPLADDRTRTAFYAGGALVLDARVPERLRSPLSRALSIEPRRRPGSAGELLDLLDRPGAEQRSPSPLTTLLSDLMPRRSSAQGVGQLFDLAGLEAQLEPPSLFTAAAPRPTPLAMDPSPTGRANGRTEDPPQADAPARRWVVLAVAGCLVAAAAAAAAWWSRSIEPDAGRPATGPVVIRTEPSEVTARSPEPMTEGRGAAVEVSPAVRTSAPVATTTAPESSAVVRRGPARSGAIRRDGAAPDPRARATPLRFKSEQARRRGGSRAPALARSLPSRARPGPRRGGRSRAASVARSPRGTPGGARSPVVEDLGAASGARSIGGSREHESPRAPVLRPQGTAGTRARGGPKARPRGEAVEPRTRLGHG
ncbi:MAG: protein kinase [Deltaproteobacteria bacterium]|nr:protein kinase [Deltaproteobacteria bacterium]